MRSEITVNYWSYFQKIRLSLLQSPRFYHSNVAVVYLPRKVKNTDKKYLSLMLFKGPCFFLTFSVPHSFIYLHLNINSELRKGDSMMLSIWEVHASNRDPAVTAADTGNQRSLGNDKRSVYCSIQTNKSCDIRPAKVPSTVLRLPGQR